MTEQTSTTLLRAFLHEHDARCPDCSYSLRNSSSERCTECGAPLALAVVSLTHKAVIWWAAAMAGTALSALIATLVAIPVFAGISDLVHQPERTQLVAAGLAPATDMPRMKTVVLVTLIALVAYALALLVLAGRKRFAALRVQQQVMLAGAAVIWPFAIFGLYALLIRHVL